MLEAINAIAQNYSALINALLTCVLVLSTVVYVWITRGMLNEMVLSRRLSIEPRLVYSINTSKFSTEFPKMPIVIKNVGRGDAFTVTFAATISYVSDEKMSRQEDRISNPRVVLKSGEEFEAEVGFMLGDDGRPLVNTRDAIGFETELRFADGDGHETVNVQLYAFNCRNLESPRPYYSLKKIYRIPLLLQLIHRITAPGYGKYWEISPISESRTIKGAAKSER